MTITEYNYYSNLAIGVFNYMNGRVNTLNPKCILMVDMYDLVERTNASIIYPNTVVIHIGNIVDSWNKDWSEYIDRNEYISTVICWALCHELYHADQFICMNDYYHNSVYKSTVEGDVERISYDWVNDHSKELSELFKFNVIIDRLDADTMPDKGNYRRASIKEFYIQHIGNVILRENVVSEVMLNLSNEIDKASDIILSFDNNDIVVIKSCGKYLRENIPLFGSMVYKYAGLFDEYSVELNLSYDIDKLTKRNILTIQFNFSNKIIHPMEFKEDK